MKKSEEYKLMADQEDNDLKAMGLMKKSVRERRWERWNEHWLEEFGQVTEVMPHPNDGFMLTCTGYGEMIFYPKANRLLLVECNKWCGQGLQMLRQIYNV